MATQKSNSWPRQWRAAVIASLQHQAAHEGVAERPELFRRLATGGAASDRAELRALFGGPPLALVKFDTPGIQGYLFRVSRPVDVEGGSALVEGLSSVDRLLRLEALADLSPGHVVYVGGGSGLLLVASCQAATVVAGLERELESKTRSSLTTIATGLPLWPWQLQASKIQDLPKSLPRGLATRGAEVSKYSAALAALDARLQQRRSARDARLPRLPSRQVHRRCEACVRQLAEEGSKLCASCDERRRLGSARKRDSQGTWKQAKSYELLVDGLSDQGIAVIYADGANIGAAFRGVDTPHQHHVLSRAVSQAMAKSCDAALAEAKRLAPWLELPFQRWQTPLQGGDDLVLILPAALAGDVVGPLARAFEQTFDRDEVLQAVFAGHAAGQQLASFGLGVGVVVADWMFPVQFSLEYAKALMKSAKKLIRTSSVRSAIDFMVLRNATPLSANIEKLRKRHFVRPATATEPGLSLTRRPYSLTDFDALQSKVSALAAVESSQRHAVRREIAGGHAVSRSYWRYQHGRSPDQRTPEGWARYRQTRNLVLKSIDEDLWQAVNGVMCTDFLDALDLVHLQERREAITARFSKQGKRGAA